MFTDHPTDIESAARMDLQNEFAASSSACTSTSSAAVPAVANPVVPNDATRLWETALAELSGKVSAQNFELWFRPITCQRVEGRTLHLSAPNLFIKEWFETNYLRIVLEEIKRLSGTIYSATWQLAEAPDAHGHGANGTPGDGEAAAKEAKPKKSHGEKRSAAPKPVEKSPPALPPPVAPPDLLVKYKFESFIVGPSNQLAEAASRAVAENPAGKYNPLFIYGGVGLGKTHLLHAIGHHIHKAHPSWRIVYLKTETFMNEYINQVRSNRIDEFRAKYRDNTDVLLMDDIQYLGGKERTQDEFFHTFNALFETHRQIVVTADKYPHEIPDLEDRIRSRFQWGLIADIQAPELETRIAILAKKAEQDGIDLPDEVAHYLAAHIKSNVRELEGLLIRVAAFAQLKNEAITVDFVNETLKGFLGQTGAQLSVETVQKEVANYFGISLAELRGQSRLANIARPRQIAMYLARKLCKASYPDLGTRFGGKDHTTVMSACKKIEKLLPEDQKTRDVCKELERHLSA